MDKRRDWIQWAARQLGVEIDSELVSQAVFMWDDSWYELNDFIIDQYSIEDAETLIDSLRFGDYAIMALAMASDDDELRELAIDKLLDRFDQRLGHEQREPKYYFRWDGTEREDYQSDADW